MHIVPYYLPASALLLSVFLTSRTSYGFIAPSFSLHLGSQATPSTTPLHVFFDSGDYHDDEDDFFDLEKARKRLEALVGDELESQLPMQTVERSPSPSYAQAQLPALDVTLPPAPPLTTIDRERREVEIRLLERLQVGDQSVSDLWTLWFSERGSAAAQRLVKADECINDGPSSWQKAEDILQELVQEHGVYWAEPVNRLATLYYMQGKLDQAETLCKVVLAVKPWHFGALSNIVMIYAAQTDSEKARLWASSRLPTFAPTGANRRRAAWSEKAVESARQSLANAEKRVQELFGEADVYTVEPDTSNNWEEDAWQ